MTRATAMTFFAAMPLDVRKVSDLPRAACCFGLRPGDWETQGAKPRTLRSPAGRSETFRTSVGVAAFEGVASHIVNSFASEQDFVGMLCSSYGKPILLMLAPFLVACGSGAGESLPRPLPQKIPSTISPETTDNSGKPNQARPIDKEWPNFFKFKTSSFSEKHEGYSPYEISAEYPEVTDAQTLATKKFNRWLRTKVMSDVARFRRLELRAEPRAKKEGRRLLTEGLELSFHVYYSDSELISLRLTHRVMAAGQMHPINYYETINYDLKRSRALRVSDVFRRGYLRVLSSYSRSFLTNTYELANDSWLQEGTAPRADNFGNWNIVPDGILLSFEDYQVSSHSFGQPEFVVPFSELREVLSQNNLMSRLRQEPR